MACQTPDGSLVKPNNFTHPPRTGLPVRADIVRLGIGEQGTRSWGRPFARNQKTCSIPVAAKRRSPITGGEAILEYHHKFLAAA